MKNFYSFKVLLRDRKDKSQTGRIYLPNNRINDIYPEYTKNSCNSIQRKQTTKSLKKMTTNLDTSLKKMYEWQISTCKELNINSHLGKQITITRAQERVNSVGLGCPNPAYSKERPVFRTDPWNIPCDILPRKSVFIHLSPWAILHLCWNSVFVCPTPWTTLYQFDQVSLSWQSEF